MEKIDRTKHKQMAYVLNKEFKYMQKDIAKLMEVSPQQMSNWIKETSYEVKINNLEKELDTAKNKLKEIGYKPLGKDINNIIIEAKESTN